MHVHGVSAGLGPSVGSVQLADDPEDALLGVRVRLDVQAVELRVRSGMLLL